MKPADRAILVKQARQRLRDRSQGMRESDNFEDRGRGDPPKDVPQAGDERRYGKFLRLGNRLRTILHERRNGRGWAS